MSPATVLLDACVLYSASLRDLLMHLAIGGLFQPRWSSEIQDEWIDALLENRPELSPSKLLRTRQLMNSEFAEALVIGYEPLIPTLSLPDSDDRHVLAAAIQAEADVLLTFNLADFPDNIMNVHGIEVWHPDYFLLQLVQLQPDEFIRAVRRQRENLVKPPMNVSDFLDNMRRQGIPQTVLALRTFSDSL